MSGFVIIVIALAISAVLVFCVRNEHDAMALILSTCLISFSTSVAVVMMLS